MDNSNIMHASTPNKTPATNAESTEYRLFFSVAGTPGKKGFPQHVWAAYLVDPDGKQVWTNTREKPLLLDGHQYEALYAVIGTAMEKTPDGGILALFAPQEEIYSVYRVTREQRRAGRYLDSKGKERARAHLIIALDDLAERRGLTLTSRPLELHDEDALLGAAREDASERWRKARGVVDSEF